MCMSQPCLCFYTRSSVARLGQCLSSGISTCSRNCKDFSDFQRLFSPRETGANFSKGGDFWWLGARFFYFSYVLTQNGGRVTSHPFYPPGSAIKAVLAHLLEVNVSPKPYPPPHLRPENPIFYTPSQTRFNKSVPHFRPDRTTWCSTVDSLRKPYSFFD